MDNMHTPVILRNGEGKEIGVGGSRLFIKLFSEATSNTLSVTEYELSPKFPGPPPHKHKVFEHAWYVLEGDLTIRLENEVSVLSKGGLFLFQNLWCMLFQTIPMLL